MGACRWMWLDFWPHVKLVRPTASMQSKRTVRDTTKWKIERSSSEFLQCSEAIIRGVDTGARKWHKWTKSKDITANTVLLIGPCFKLTFWLHLTPVWKTNPKNGFAYWSVVPKIDRLQAGPISKTVSRYRWGSRWKAVGIQKQYKAFA